MSKKKKIETEDSTDKIAAAENDYVPPDNILEPGDSPEIAAESKSLKKRFASLRDSLRSLTDREDSIEIVGNQTGDESVHDSTYGITVRGRIAAAYVITLCIMAFILAGSFILAVYLPGDNGLVDSFAEELRQNDVAYRSLQSQKESIEAEVAALSASIDEKQESIDSLDDYDNTKADLRTRIEEQKNILVSLTSQLNEKQSELDEINESIAQKAGAVITLPPGKYVVGTNLPIGKYSVSGSGKFQAASADGVSKANELLSSATIEIVLEKDDIIKIESTTKFTPIG